MKDSDCNLGSSILLARPSSMVMRVGWGSSAYRDGRRNKGSLIEDEGRDSTPDAGRSLVVDWARRVSGDDVPYAMNLTSNASDSSNTRTVTAAYLNRRTQAIVVGVPLNCSPPWENGIHSPVHKYSDDIAASRRHSIVAFGGTMMGACSITGFRKG